MQTVTDPQSLDISAILGRLPHRHPFLLVDRVLEIRPGQSIRALKNVTYNEPFFTGHFPSRPLMPGVIVIEALAQTAGILSVVTAGVLREPERLDALVGTHGRPNARSTQSSSRSGPGNHNLSNRAGG